MLFALQAALSSRPGEAAIVGRFVGWRCGRCFSLRGRTTDGRTALALYTEPSSAKMRDLKYTEGDIQIDRTQFKTHENNVIVDAVVVRLPFLALLLVVD